MADPSPSAPMSTPEHAFVHWHITGQPGDWWLSKWDGAEQVVPQVRGAAYLNDLIEFARFKGMLPLVHPNGRLDVSGT